MPGDTLAIGIVISSFIIIHGLIKAIGAGAQLIADRIDNNSRLTDHVAKKIDNLWGPLNGLNRSNGGLPSHRYDPEDMD